MDEAEVCRLLGYGSGIYELVRGIAARTRGMAGIVDVIAGLEVGHGRPDCFDGTGAVEADDLRCGDVVVVVWVVIVDMAPYLNVNWVYAAGFDSEN